MDWLKLLLSLVLFVSVLQRLLLRLLILSVSAPRIDKGNSAYCEQSTNGCHDPRQLIQPQAETQHLSEEGLKKVRITCDQWRVEKKAKYVAC